MDIRSLSYQYSFLSPSRWLDGGAEAGRGRLDIN